jgi:hypothetical protein
MLPTAERNILSETVSIRFVHCPTQHPKLSAIPLPPPAVRHGPNHPGYVTQKSETERHRPSESDQLCVSGLHFGRDRPASTACQLQLLSVGVQPATHHQRPEQAFRHPHPGQPTVSAERLMPERAHLPQKSAVEGSSSRQKPENAPHQKRTTSRDKLRVLLL